jgi:phospholipid/cholesterol/gamma-HCH transport system substrate-binding protein
MAKKTINTVKLGIFVLSGLLFLVLLLYMIGKNRNLFGPAFVLKARFENVQGLVPGNNVRFAGIEVGTVKRIHIISDSLLEVIMVVDDKMNQFIRNNAIVSIGTDGLMGNKVINIVPSHTPASLVKEGDVLASRKAPDTDDMLRTLNKTNHDIAVIAGNLKATVQRINSSNALWKLLNDESLSQNLKTAAANVQLATARAASMANDLQVIIQDVKKGKGPMGTMLRDTAFAQDLTEAILKIKDVGDHANKLAVNLDDVVTDLQQSIQYGKGPVHALLKDTSIVIKLNISLDNIQKGTDGFNQNMEALKHNFLFRRYFKKQERQKQKESKHNLVVE